MSKEKAIRLLRDAHKHRAYAEKLERIAHKQLDDASHDEHLGLHDEHEVHASVDRQNAISNGIDHAHAYLSGIHRAIGDHLKATGHHEHAKRQHKLADKHRVAANFSRPNESLTNSAKYTVAKKFGKAGTKGFDFHGARTAVPKLRAEIRGLKEQYKKLG